MNRYQLMTISPIYLSTFCLLPQFILKQVPDTVSFHLYVFLKYVSLSYRDPFQKT